MSNLEYKNSKPLLLTGRLAFMSILTPKGSKQNPDRKSYRAAILLPKGSADEQLLMGTIKEQVAGYFGKTSKAHFTQFDSTPGRRCWADGDTFFDSEGNVAAGFEGQTLFTSLRPEGKPPLIFDTDGNEIKPSDTVKWQAEGRKFYRGCNVTVCSKIWLQDGANAGVRCELLAIQFKSDGERLAGQGDEPDVKSLFSKAPTAEAKPFGSAPSFVDDED